MAENLMEKKVRRKRRRRNNDDGKEKQKEQQHMFCWWQFETSSIRDEDDDEKEEEEEEGEEGYRNGNGSWSRRSRSSNRKNDDEKEVESRTVLKKRSPRLSMNVLLLTSNSQTTTTSSSTSASAASSTTRRRRGRRRRRRRRQNSIFAHFNDSFCDIQNESKMEKTNEKSGRRGRSCYSKKWFLYLLFSIFLTNFTTETAPHIVKSRQSRVNRLIDLKSDFNNSSSMNPSFHEISRNAFLSLHGTPIEARLPSYHIDEGGGGVESNQLPDASHLYQQQKKNRRPEKLQQKIIGDLGEDVILSGRKHALLHLSDPEALKMTQRCDGQKFKQRVRVDGCLTKVVVNRLCHGACASFFIPRMHSKKLKAAFKSCATCAPSDYDYVDITLTCPGRIPSTATRTIVKVKSCKCREVSISSLYA